MNDYTIEKYRCREDWLKARGIGGSDLCSLVNKVGRWGNFVDVYDRLTNPVQEKADSEAMANGRKAEEPLKTLFLLMHSHLKRSTPSKSIWLMRRKDYPEITLSPDTLVNDTKTNQLGFVEIKLKQIFNESMIPNYLMSLKDEDPQYWWQVIHYFIMSEKIKFGYLAVGFQIMTKENETWIPDKLVLNWLRINREDVANDIEAGTSALHHFIIENLRPRVRPKTILENQQEEKIEWTKLSSIQTLKR